MNKHTSTSTVVADLWALERPDDSDSTSTWDDDGTSALDASHEEACSLLDEGCADESYWEDETAADAWLARFLGGTSARTITVEWLPALPRLVEFLGKEGCAILRYLDIWDTLNGQGEEIAGYQEIITSIMQFPDLLHLRLKRRRNSHLL